MKNIKVLGIDLAKNVFQVHGTDAQGKCVLRKRLTRTKFNEFIATVSQCVIGFEACGGSHYWGRYFERYGHDVRMMAPQFVKPYVKSNKNDAKDAEAIAEACTRPGMRFVGIKSQEQQDVLMIHRARELSMKNRTAQGNQIRGFLHEYGVVLEKGHSKIRRVAEVLEAHSDKLSQLVKTLIQELYEQYQAYDKQVKKYDKQIEALSKESSICQELQKIMGVGPLIATGIVATIGDPKAFKNGREVSAWLGLTPKQYSSGEKIRLGGISKRGDRYMRKMVIQGARSAVMSMKQRDDKLGKWILDKKSRGGLNKAAVALANKNVRMMWAIMATGECYRYSGMKHEVAVSA